MSKTIEIKVDTDLIIENVIREKFQKAYEQFNEHAAKWFQSELKRRYEERTIGEAMVKSWLGDSYLYEIIPVRALEYIQRWSNN